MWYPAIAVIIVAFVVFYNPAGPSQGGRGQMNHGTIAGRPITSSEYQEAIRDLYLLVYLRTGQWPGGKSDFEKFRIDPEREAYNRILVSELIRQQDVQVSPEAVANWIKTVFVAGEGRAFERAIYDRFVADIAKHGAGLADIERFARFEVGRQHLANVFGAPGELVTPSEARNAFHRENDLMVTEAVLFPATNYLALVRTDAASLATYYTNRAANYRIPDKRAAAYVAFAYSNYFAAVDQEMAKMTNLQQELEQEYLRIGATNFTDEVTGQVLSKEAGVAKLRSQAREQAAEIRARQDAAKIINHVFAATSLTNGEANYALLRAVAATNNATVELSAPFERSGVPAGLDVPPEFGQAAWSVTPVKPVASSPIVGKNAAYVVGFGASVPGRAQTLDEVKAKLTEDYRNDEALRLAREAGQVFASAVTNAANAGKKFSEIAKNLGHEAQAVPEFSLSSTAVPGLDPALPLGYLQNVGYSLKPGESSPYQQIGRVGVVMHLVERKPVDEAAVQAGLPAFTKRVQEQRRSQVFMDWINRQAKQLNLSLPPQAGS